MDSSLGDFFRQVPFGLIAAPIFFGVVYIGLMIFIFRRAAQRRRLRAKGQNPNSAQLVTNRFQQSRTRPLIGNESARLAGILTQLPFLSSFVAQNPSSGSNSLPEPDLELLIEPSLALNTGNVKLPADRALSQIPPEFSGFSSNLPSVVVAEKAVETTEKVDWLSMMSTGSSTPNTSTSNNAMSDNADHNDMVEVMRVWRDLGDGRLIIELGGRRYSSVSDISNVELLRRFTGVVRELWQMVNAINGGASNRSTPTPPGTGAPNAGINVVGAGSGGNTLPSGLTGNPRTRIGTLNPSSTEAEQEASKPRGILRGVSRQSATATDSPRRPGIGDAVEDYLQFKLSSTPALQARSIHVRPAADGGVRIEVDGHYYDGIGDVVDADVRDFLLATLREWEARQ